MLLYHSLFFLNFNLYSFKSPHDIIIDNSNSFGPREKVLQGFFEDKIKEGLANMNLMVEDWGGKIHGRRVPNPELKKVLELFLKIQVLKQYL